VNVPRHWLATSRRYSVDPNDARVLLTEDEAEQHRTQGWRVDGPYVEASAYQRTAAWRFYLLLALFDRRDGTAISDFVQEGREAYEREGFEADAWERFDALWNRLTSKERLSLVKTSIAHEKHEWRPVGMPADHYECSVRGCTAKTIEAMVYVPAEARRKTVEALRAARDIIQHEFSGDPTEPWGFIDEALDRFGGQASA
jgi:hypothetical protein